MVKQIQTYLQGNDFMATLTLRLIPINFDMINYVCGIYGVKRKPYALATAIGIIPGMITYVLI
ncbi:VTT domain-containing protein [Patescibacteria group bacterium]|nr:VTT domain-containing protein [Patescibacteria group bacterium]